MRNVLTGYRFIYYNIFYSEKCYDREEYISTRSKERRCMVRIFVTDLWK